MIRLKEGRTCLVARQDGTANGAGCGLYRHDTRLLSGWSWACGEARTLATEARDGQLWQHLALADATLTQVVGLTRELHMSDTGLDDVWIVHNTSLQPRTVTLSLDVEADFRDVFAVWGGKSLDPATPVVREAMADGLSLTRCASDATTTTITLRTQPADPGLSWTFELAPGATRTVRVELRIDDTQDEPVQPLPDRASFVSRRVARLSDPAREATVRRALDDLRSLLLPTPFGPYPAAGLPNFVNVFGRDALITSMMLGPAFADVSEAVLRLLAHHQGRVVDPFREEEPGKILHEIRRGEVSRTGTIPFGRYYGSIDSTPLFIMALEAHVAQSASPQALLDDLTPAFEAALGWLVGQQAADGLVRFAPSGSGLVVQSWKDSHDSMNHADGRPAEAPLAVAEVQGYAFAAFEAAARLFERCGNADRAADCKVRAARLAGRFHQLYWLPTLGTYAMALDRDGAPLEVLSSDPGHLLWCGIVPAEVAPALVTTLMGSALWSGWGLRTLGSGEVRYNPVSYHNGAVWPHDTALFGWGLHRYGFAAERDLVAAALFDLADASPGGSLPELVSGFQRVEGRRPVAYTHACAPQAWAAAGLIMMARLTGGGH